jgi:hypothetical protein
MSSIKHVRFDKLWAVLLLIALAGSLVVYFWFRVPLGFSLIIFFVGWPIGGTLVTIDEDLEGGWSNPDGTVRPHWLEAPFWGQIAGGLALSLADLQSTLVGSLQTAPGSGAWAPRRPS